MSINKKDAEKQFRELWKVILKSKPHLKGDTIAKREEWFCFIDNLRAERCITLHQYNTWVAIC